LCEGVDVDMMCAAVSLCPPKRKRVEVVCVESLCPPKKKRVEKVYRRHLDQLSSVTLQTCSDSKENLPRWTKSYRRIEGEGPRSRRRRNETKTSERDRKMRPEEGGVKRAKSKKCFRKTDHSTGLERC
jgi:hypothetical protein